MRYWQHDETGRLATSDDDVDLAPRYYEISKEDFEREQTTPKIVDNNAREKKLAGLAEQYAYVIEGALGYAWDVPLAEMKKSETKNIEFIKAQFVFLLRHFEDENQTTPLL